MTDVGADYSSTIADLERKRDEIDRTIAMLRALAGMPAMESSARNGGSPSGPVEFTNKHFFGLKVPEAVLLYLDSVKEARSAARITQDLLEHGLTTTAESPAEVIRTALRRLEKAGEVVQIKKEWGRPSWYPGLRRPGREAGAESESRKPNRSSTKRKAKGGAKKPVASKARPKSPKVEGKTSKPESGKGPYKAFMDAQFASGASIKEANAAWNEHKKKMQQA